MSDEILEQIITHIEFLGYDVSRQEGYVAAKHPKYFNLILRQLNFGNLFTAFFGINAAGKGDRPAVLEAINWFNRKAAVCRGYIDKDFDLAIEAWFPQLYDRAAFGLFIDSLNNDLRYLSDEEVNLRAYIE